MLFRSLERGDRDLPDGDAGEIPKLRLGREPFDRRRLHQVDRQLDLGRGGIRQPQDSEAAHLAEAGKRRGWGGDQPSGLAAKAHLIVGDQDRRHRMPSDLPGAVHQPEREIGLARARRTDEQHALSAKVHTAGMERNGVSHCCCLR